MPGRAVLKERHPFRGLTPTAKVCRVAATLACFVILLFAPTLLFSQPQPPSQWPAPRHLDLDLLKRHGLRVLEGKHVTIVTDLPSSAEINSLPKLVDAAVPHWAKRFDVPPSGTDNWRVLACVIDQKERFLAARLMPGKHSDFPHGLSLGYELWVNNQASDYYRRHLLLHEATHSFMATNLGSCGPGWYMEAIAELLGSHAWNPATGDVLLGIMQSDGRETRSVGRVGLLQQAFQQKQALSIPAVMKINNDRLLSNQSYAWVWALANLLDQHPRYQQRFRELPKFVLQPDFDNRFRQLYRDDWSDLQTEWRIMIATIQYGHDIPREAIEFKQGAPITSTAAANISSSRGWQSTGVLVEAGKKYRIKTDGRFTIAVDPDGTPIPCEAGGVTLDYHAGRPLGVLLAAIDSRKSADGNGKRTTGLGSFLNPVTMGLATHFTPNRTGTLYLRVNDSPAKLRDNDGELRVTIAR